MNPIVGKYQVLIGGFSHLRVRSLANCIILDQQTEKALYSERIVDHIRVSLGQSEKMVLAVDLLYQVPSPYNTCSWLSE